MDTVDTNILYSYNSEDNTVTIKPAFRNIVYIVEVKATDVRYDVISTDTQLFTVIEDTPLRRNIYNPLQDITEMYNTVYMIDINNHLINALNETLTYSVATIPPIPISRRTGNPAAKVDNNILVLEGDFRNITYEVVITVFNTNYSTHYLNLEFNVTEVVAPSPLPISNNAIYNIPFDFTNVEYRLNLDDLFYSSINTPKPFKYVGYDTNIITIKPTS